VSHSVNSDRVALDRVENPVHLSTTAKDATSQIPAQFGFFIGLRPLLSVVRQRIYPKSSSSSSVLGDNITREPLGSAAGWSSCTWPFTIVPKSVIAGTSWVQGGGNSWVLCAACGVL